jgi:CRP-like cAMP-binding protein
VAVFDGGRYPASAEATSATTLLRLSADSFRQTCLKKKSRNGSEGFQSSVAFCDRTGKHEWLRRALREAQARAEVCIVVCELPEDFEFFVQAEFLVASDHRDLFAHGLGDDLAVERVRVV